MYLEFQTQSTLHVSGVSTQSTLHVSGVPDKEQLACIWSSRTCCNQSHLDLARRFLIPVPLRVVVVLVPDLVMSDPLQGVRPSHGDHPLHYGHVVERHLDKLPLIVVLGTPATLM